MMRGCFLCAILLGLVFPNTSIAETRTTTAKLQKQVKALKAEVTQLKGMIASLTEAQKQVPASNVMLAPATSSSRSFIKSSNLQDALNNELAIDLSALLPGTTWSITNITSDRTYTGSTGRVTFDADGTTLILENGLFAAAGICGIPVEPAQYKVLANGLMSVTWNNYGVTNEVAPLVFANDANTLKLVGSGGCGALGLDRVSILSRVAPSN